MIKRDPLDAVFSDLIRERAGYACEHCQLVLERGQMQCAHLISRAWKGGRWWPDNAVCLCASCHGVFTINPLDFTRWLDSYLGQQHIDLLRERKQQPIKYTKADKREMLAHYREELKRLRQLRDEGTIGRLEFVGFL